MATPGLNLGSVSPAALAAAVNDLQLAGSFARLTPNVAGTTITGFLAAEDGHVLVVVNLGNAAITINHQDAGSLAANRIITIGGAAKVLVADATATFVYDLTTARWRQTV